MGIWEDALNAVAGLQYDYDGEADKLSSSEGISTDRLSELESVGADCIEGDVPIYITCNKCWCYMETIGGDFVCPECGAKVSENQVYDKIQEENNRFLKD